MEAVRNIDMIPPLLQIGPCDLYLGDATELLPNMVAAGLQSDLVLTDPPYLLTSGGQTGGGMQERFGDGTGRSYDNSGELVPCDIDWPDFMPLLYAALGRGHCYTMANNRNVQAMLNAAEAAGFGFHNLLVWDKITATANRWYMKNLEFVGFFYKGNARMINDCAAKQLIRCAQVDESKHPTEKPVELMGHYIRMSSQPGQIVLDPFMGSGSTGVAAVAAGRKFIGIEKDENFFRMAVTRITRACNAVQMELI